MKRTKFRIIACLMVVVCCMTAFSATAFASDGGGTYESDENGGSTPPSSIDSITVSTEQVALPENQGSEALTPEGNLSLIDDILQAENYASDEGVTVGNKQFITVQGKSGNYFYIVIDRSGETENVYFLNLVDEADLMALMEDGSTDKTPACTCKDKCVAGDVDTTCPVCKSNMSECAGNEAAVTTPEPDNTEDPDADADGGINKGKSSNSALLLVVLFVAAGGGGALYWFKFRKPKPQTKGSDDLDDYDYGEDEDDEDMEYETEDDEPEAGSDDE